MANKTNKFAHNPGMGMVISYIIFWLTNIMVLWLAARWFPQYIVLGTLSLTTTWALCLSMNELALINTLSKPFFRHQCNKKLINMGGLKSSFIVNFIGVWTITRFAEVFGLGVTSWVVVAWLAIALSLVQRAIMMKLKGCSAK
ncbi:MAG: hypothetical protein ABII10_02915 [Candidatus Paceibacterota bacterium]